MVKKFLSSVVVLGLSAFLSSCTFAIGYNTYKIYQEKKNILELEKLIKLEGFIVKQSEKIYCNSRREYVNKEIEPNVIIRWQEKGDWLISSATRIREKIEKERPFAFKIGKRLGKNEYSNTIIVLDNGYKNLPEDGKIDWIGNHLKTFCEYLPNEISVENYQTPNTQI